MRPTVGSLANTMYRCRVPYDIQTRQTTMRGEHRMYATTDCRCNITLPQFLTHWTRINGTKSVGGNAICLPYDNDHISSVRLPHNAAMLGIDFFYTADMSGCKFFVDSIAGSQDLIVYHANSNPPGTGQNQAPDFQAPGVTTTLNDLHTRAKNDYNLTLNDKTSLAKPDYNHEAAQLMLRKRARVQERQDKLKMDIKKRQLNFGGGTIIVGYPGNAGWQFYYQTWGKITYTRPSGVVSVLTAAFTFHWNYLHKLRTRGTEEEIIAMSVIDHGEF